MKNSMQKLNARFSDVGITVRRENGKYIVTGDDGKSRTARNLETASWYCSLAYQYGFSAMEF